MAAENDVLSEIEVLQSIYLDELKVTQKKNGGWEVNLVLYPSTAEDVFSQFVRLTLTLTLSPQYPCIPPVISIHNPRGLSDDKLLSVQRCLQTEAESCPGAPVLYQVIEKAKEILTESNIPHGNCVICLYGFKDGEAFTKTSCYHYFHSHCLGRYIIHSETELREREKEIEEDKSRGMMEGEELAVVCPVCREALVCDVDALLSAPAPASPEMTGEVVGAEFRHKWVELQKILERQRRKGGIIDPEEESNRFLIHINEGPSEASDPASGTTDLSPSPLETQSPVIQPSLPQPSQGSGQGIRRSNPGRRGQGHKKGGRRGRGGYMRAEITEAMPDFTKLSLASEKCSHVRGEETSLNGTCVDTGSCGDPREQEGKPIEEGKLVDIKGQDSTEAGKSEAYLGDQALQLTSTETSSEDINAPQQAPSQEKPNGRGPWLRGRRWGSRHHRNQQPGQWQDRNFREGETRDTYHHRGHRGRTRGRGRGGGGSSGSQSHQSRGGGGVTHYGAPHGSHHRTESGPDRPVL